jgi:formylglycine-generating enzyme required for sulfatase activity
LPDPVPVAPADAGKDGHTGTPIAAVPDVPKIATPAPSRPGGLIGGTGAEIIGASPSANTDVPDSLAGASAGTAPGGKTPPETVKPHDGNTALAALPEPPQPPGKLDLPANATTAQLDAARRDREAAIEELRKTIAAADTAHDEATRRLDAAKIEKDRRQKELASKRKVLAPVIQQSDALEAERKKLEDESLRAQAAAEEAAKQAEAAREKLADAVAKGGAKLKARQQAEAELNAMTAELAALGTESDGLSQLAAKADAMRQQARTFQQQAEQDLKKITASEENARHSDMEAQRKANLERIAAIDRQVQDLTAQAARFNATIEPLKELGEAGKEAIKKIEEKQKATRDQIDELQAEAKRLSAGMTTLPGKGAGPVKSTPTPAPSAKTEKTPPANPNGAEVVNSLGMKFAPVGDVQFAVYLTTRKDFEAFAAATGLKSDSWRNPGFKQEADHPVVNVTWREAEAFCKWLTEKERKAGLLKSGEIYRLPTDVEWSKAVGLPAESGATPEERDMGVPDVYPWGRQWPPPADAGNYAGEETQTEIPIPSYNDGYANTSPVGKFRANEFGLYDMGGNVWQWVSDYWNSENRAKTLRGGSWYNGAIPLSLLSSCRISSSPDTLHDTYGFRIVKGIDPGRGRRK